MPKPRILILDDNPQVLEVGLWMMERLGIDAEGVREGTQAVQRYKETLGTTEAFAAVIADLTVPDGMGGVECREQLNAIDPDVKVIACSGASADPVLIHHEQSGFVAALTKPFRLGDVRKLLEEVLGNPLDSGRASEQ